jgi:ElaB/YqjD/DUF883 family membrane-anchored ribosome-binding protein
MMSPLDITSTAGAPSSEFEKILAAALKNSQEILKKTVQESRDKSDADARMYKEKMEKVLQENHDKSEADAKVYKENLDKVLQECQERIEADAKIYMDNQDRMNDLMLETIAQSNKDLMEEMVSKLNSNATLSKNVKETLPDSGKENTEPDIKRSLNIQKLSDEDIYDIAAKVQFAKSKKENEVKPTQNVNAQYIPSNIVFKDTYASKDTFKFFFGNRKHVSEHSSRSPVTRSA